MMIMYSRSCFFKIHSFWHAFDIYEFSYFYLSPSPERYVWKSLRRESAGAAWGRGTSTKWRQRTLTRHRWGRGSGPCNPTPTASTFYPSCLCPAVARSISLMEAPTTAALPRCRCSLGSGLRPGHPLSRPGHAAGWRGVQSSSCFKPAWLFPRPKPGASNLTLPLVPCFPKRNSFWYGTL